MGFRAADIPAQRGRPPEGTRIDGREINGHEHDALFAKRVALLAAGGPREQAALSLLRNGRIEGDVLRDATALARSRVAGQAQREYGHRRRDGAPLATAKRDRDRAAATEPSDLDVARALAEMLPARAQRRPALTDKRALAAAAIEWEVRRLRRHDDRERARHHEWVAAIGRSIARSPAGGAGIAALAQPAAVLRDRLRRSLLSGLFLRR